MKAVFDTDDKPAAGYRDKPDFIAYKARVLKFIERRKSAKFSSLNPRFRNGLWLGEALEKLESEGKISKRQQTEKIAVFSIAGGREIVPDKPMTKDEIISGVLRRKRAENIYRF